MNSLLDATDILLCYEFVWPNYMYLVCIIVRGDVFQPVERCISVKVFRLPSTMDQEIGTANLPNIDAYIHGFLEFIHSDRKTNPGFKYELIYADPPLKLAGNLPESKPSGASQAQPSNLCRSPRAENHVSINDRSTVSRDLGVLVF